MFINTYMKKINKQFDESSFSKLFSEFDENKDG
jgi:hypothetical protein